MTEEGMASDTWADRFLLHPVSAALILQNWHALDFSNVFAPFSIRHSGIEGFTPIVGDPVVNQN